jgi:integrase
MARTLRDARLDTREARSRLRVQGKPHWRLLEPGLHLGYRRLAKRPGTWCVRRYVGGQTYTVETLKGVVADDFANADGKTVLDFKQAQQEVLKHKPKAAGALTVADAVEQYLVYLSENGKSADDARYRADALILPSLGAVEVAALSTEKLRGWLAALAKTPAKRKHESGAEPLRRRRSTANRTLTILKAALNLAFREGHVPADGAWRRVRPFRGVDAARLRYLNISEAQRLINGCDPDLRKLVQAALQSGCRYGELARMVASDFNPDSNTVTVRQSKSGKPRHVFLTDEGAALFGRWCAGKAGNALLFTRDGEPWQKSNQGRPMKLACQRAGVTPPIGFHILRHTYASLAIMGGAPLLVVARNLGHSDGRMCEQHYGHLSASYVGDAIRAAAPRFGIEPDDKVAVLRR